MDKRIVLTVYCILFLITGIVITQPSGILLLLPVCFLSWILYFSILHFCGKNDRPPAPLNFIAIAAKSMKESLLKSRICRLIVAICCTAMSYMGLGITFAEVAAPSHQNLFFYFSILWSAAWAAYFLILFFWIKNGRAPKPLMITGTTLGGFSVAISLGWGLAFTFPAIILMLYVNSRSLDTPKAA